MPKHPDLRTLTEELATLRARVDDQAAELATLRQSEVEEPVSRRHLLRGLAGLGAAGVAGVAAAQPAAAADGDPLLLGQENTSTNPTVLTGDGIEIDAGFVGIRATGGFAGVIGHAEDQGIGVLASSGSGGVAFVAASVEGPTIGAESEDGVTLRLSPATQTGPPTLEYPDGSFRVDALRDVWLCIAAGTPGIWTRLLREDTAPGRVIPITPVRVLDTRATGGRAGGAPVVPGQKKGPLKGLQSVTLDLAGAGPIPTTASAVVGNATVLTPSGTGFLRILPAGASVPASTFSFTTGVTIANGFTCALAAAGLTATAPISSAIAYHLVIDIAAYIT